MNTIKLLADVRKLLTAIDNQRHNMTTTAEPVIIAAAVPVRAHLIDTNEELAEILERVAQLVGKGQGIEDEALNRRVDALRNWHAETQDGPKGMTSTAFASLLRELDAITQEIPF